jgi:release factor glutamine methyltransferase
MNSNQPLPEEYTDGYVVFMGQRFITDKRALIPRLETEELVKYCLKFLEKNPQIQTIADIGTGSGIIPISLGEKMDRPLKVFATDMSQDALDVAEENFLQIQNAVLVSSSSGN